MAEMDPNRYDYREVACPQCHAAAGTYCIRPSGHSGPIVQPHRPRRTAAHVVWRAEEIEKYGRQLTSRDDDTQPAVTPAPAVAKAPAATQQLGLFDAPEAPTARAA